MSDYYNRNAQQLFEKYQSLDPNKVHASWLEYLPSEAGLALDVGAGSGRDAIWLAEMGWKVIAVEPAKSLRELGQNASKAYSVTWSYDCLPNLTKLIDYKHKFSLILVSGVLMHLPYEKRITSLETLINLMATDAVLIVTLRQGPDIEDRELYTVTADEIEQFAKEKSIEVKARKTLADELKREGVTWHTIIVKNRTAK